MSRTRITSPFMKSSHSGGGSANECVEVARTADGGRAVRDSKCPERGTQFHSPGAWQAFLRPLKD